MLGNYVTPITTSDEIKRDYFTVQDFIDTFDAFIIYKKAENLSDRTITDYTRLHNYMTNWIKEWYSDTLVRYDIMLLKSYINWMLEQVQPSTVNIRIRYLKVYLKFLEEEGYVKESINHRIKKVKEVRNEKLPLTDSDVRKMLKQINMKSYAGLRDYTVITLMLSVGTRINETINIRVKDVDLKSKTITICGETAKNRTERVVPLNAKIIPNIKKLIEVSNEVSSPWLFLSTISYDQVKLTHMKQQISDYGIKAGLDKSSSPHKLRHTAITNMIRNGANPFDVCKIAGHSSLEITMKYFHNKIDDLHKAIENDTLSVFDGKGND